LCLHHTVHGLDHPVPISHRIRKLLGGTKENQLFKINTAEPGSLLERGLILKSIKELEHHLCTKPMTQTKKE